MIEVKSAKPRSLANSETLEQDVKKIIEEVRAAGDAALVSFNERFDDCKRESLRISAEELAEAYELVPSQDLADIQQARDNIIAFAKEQRLSIGEVRDFEPMPGIHLGHRVIPVDSVCCYVPGGGYPLFSTALMLGIPANVAGVRRVIACSPTMKGTGKIHPYTLVALDQAGVDEIYAIGGAQAVAAVAYGTETIAPVDMIVGPGNSFVTEAKRQVYGKVGIDFLAGPSEVLVIADETADPSIIASDLLAQSEHDKVAKAILVTTDLDLADRVITAVEAQLEVLPTAEIARASWNDYGEVLLAGSLDEAIDYANDYAPEHLEVLMKDPMELLGSLDNAGSIFLGHYASEPLGDYFAGPNHVLPTSGTARFFSPLGVASFTKRTSYTYYTRDALEAAKDDIVLIAEREGLTAHANAIKVRFE